MITTNQDYEQILNNLVFPNSIIEGHKIWTTCTGDILSLHITHKNQFDIPCTCRTNMKITDTTSFSDLRLFFSKSLDIFEKDIQRKTIISKNNGPIKEEDFKKLLEDNIIHVYYNGEFIKDEVNPCGSECILEKIENNYQENLKRFKELDGITDEQRLEGIENNSEVTLEDLEVEG